MVHHKNGDWRDNRIGNLECVPCGAHATHHLRERWGDANFRARGIKQLDAARDKASEWHRSAEGKEWHRGHGKRTWAERKPAPATCTVCHAEFQTYTPKHTRFCSRACAQRGCYARQCTRPAVCAHCGKAFMANRYRVVTCCSRLCANRKRAGDRRVQPDA